MVVVCEMSLVKQNQCFPYMPLYTSMQHWFWYSNTDSAMNYCYLLLWQLSVWLGWNKPTISTKTKLSESAKHDPTLMCLRTLSLLPLFVAPSLGCCQLLVITIPANCQVKCSGFLLLTAQNEKDTRIKWVVLHGKMTYLGCVRRSIPCLVFERNSSLQYD